jgi:hypothetical protein
MSQGRFQCGRINKAGYASGPLSMCSYKQSLICLRAAFNEVVYTKMDMSQVRFQFCINKAVWLRAAFNVAA